MMKTQKLFILIFISLTVPGLKSASASSFYSSTGLGISQYYTNAQANGMGGIGLAIVDELGINELNPAAVESYGLTRVIGDFSWEETVQKQVNSQGRARFASPASFRVLLPVKKRTSISFAFNPVARTKVDFTTVASFGSESYTREIIQDGGLSRGVISLKFSPFNFVNLGLGANFNFGKYTETWKIDFFNDTYIDGKDVFSTYVQGTNFTVGTLLTPVKNLNVAMIYENKVKLNGNTTLRYGSANEDEVPDRHPTLASSFGLGFSYLLYEKFLIGMDYMQRNWSENNISDISVSSLNNDKRIGFGLQFRAKKDLPATILQRFAFRLGGYYHLLAFQEADGDNISEAVLSFGLGIPFQGNRGRFDLALEYGQRGNLSHNALEEDIIRFSVSLIGAERWFVRRY